MNTRSRCARAKSAIRSIINEWSRATLKSFLTSVMATLGFESTGNLYKLKNGITVKFSPGTLDRMVIRECLINDLYSDCIKEEQLDTILDLGSHKGYFLLGLLARGIHIKKAVCVEPLSGNIETFEENMALNASLKGALCGNVSLENAAVSVRDGVATFFITRNSVNHSLHDPSKFDEVVRQEEVRTISIQSIFDKHRIKGVDLVKLDIEGSEFDLFESPDIAKLLAAKYVVMEIHPDEGRQASHLIGIMERSGFCVSYPNPAYPDLIVASAVGWRSNDDGVGAGWKAEGHLL